MKIGIVCYPTYGGSGVVATELGKALARKGHEVHFITYQEPVRLDFFNQNIFYHEVSALDYPLFQYQPYESALASKIVDVAKFERLDILHVHYAIPHASSALMARNILQEQNYKLPFVTTLHGTSIETKIRGGRALNVLGAFTGYRKLSNSEYRSIMLGSQTARDKFRGQKGNSPDPQLRSQNVS